jgi:SSS family solute:Na+ symporter
VDSTLNSASTLVTMDFVKKWKPDAGNRLLVIVGRIVTGVFMLLAAAWAPVILDFPSLWQYLQTVLAYLSPPVVACFVIGLFWTGANRHSAFAGLIVGHVAAIALAVAEWQIPGFGIQFLYLPPILFAVSGLTIAGVSWAGEDPDPAVIEAYTWNPTHIERELEHVAAFPWYKNFLVQSGALLALIGVVLVLFW